MEYKIVSWWGLEEFQELVKDHIESGWVPQGGVSVAFDPDDDEASLHFSQAMIKHPTNEGKRIAPPR